MVTIYIFAKLMTGFCRLQYVSNVACLEHKEEQEIEFFCMPKWALAFKVKLPRNKKGVIVAGSRLGKQAR